MKKSQILTHLSLRAKFKTEKLVEVCIINQATGAIQLEWIPIDFTISESVDVKDAEVKKEDKVNG